MANNNAEQYQRMNDHDLLVQHAVKLDALSERIHAHNMILNTQNTMLQTHSNLISTHTEQLRGLVMACKERHRGLDSDMKALAASKANKSNPGNSSDDTFGISKKTITIIVAAIAAGASCLYLGGKIAGWW